MSSTPPPQPAGRPVAQVLRPLRDLTAYALVAAPALWLFVAVIRLIPSGVGQDFLTRVQNSFYSFVNVEMLLLPLAGVLMATMIQPMHKHAKLITIAALVEYAVAGFFAIIFGFLIALVRIADWSARVAFEELLVRVGWLAVFAAAAYAVLLIWRNLFHTPKPQAQPGMYGQPQQWQQQPYGQPGYQPGQPGQPGYQPGQPGFPPPGQPGFAPPGQPGFAPPAQPGFAPPGQPGFPPPGQPGYGQPAQQHPAATPPLHQPGHAPGGPGQPQPGEAPSGFGQPQPGQWGQPPAGPGWGAPTSAPPSSTSPAAAPPVSAQPASGGAPGTPPGPFVPAPGHPQASGAYSAQSYPPPGQQQSGYADPTQAIPHHESDDADRTRIVGEETPPRH